MTYCYEDSSLSSSYILLVAVIVCFVIHLEIHRDENHPAFGYNHRLVN